MVSSSWHSFLTYALNLFDASPFINSTMSYNTNPILDHQPPFSRSLPIQVLLIGIIFTLTCVLIIHLLFTAQYHWPLAPVNFVLQMSGVLSLLISQIATLHVVTQSTRIESKNWPYMLTYLAVDIPPLLDLDRWTTGGIAGWLLMNAVTSGIIQITHIQFLTLLYPSTLEKRLILSLLAPLAIVSAVMQLLPLHPGDKVSYWSDAVRNVCNATLSLLFTLSLFLWGFFIKRDTAWRTDGGTAAFGAGALFLALLSTALTFVYIPSKDQYNWLSPLICAVIMWQSFLGWWWWVGSGMTRYGRETVEEALHREEKKDRKRKAKRARRSAQREKARTMLKGVTEAFRPKTVGENVEEQPHLSDTSSIIMIHGSQSTAASTTASEAADSPIAQFFMRWYLQWRHAHRTAARKQAVERNERINQAYDGDAGWGLGSFAMRRMNRKGTDTEESCSEVEAEVDIPPQSQPQPQPRQEPRRENPSTSVSWWGPFKKWRHQDTTLY